MAGSPRHERRRTLSRGQTETIGVVLILAMTLVGATVALAFGASGLNAVRLDSQQGGVEHAMTQLDSRTAMVALGDSDVQEVPLAAGEGSYRLDPDAGWINVTHSDYDGSGSSEEIYNESLGALVYQKDDTRIAYQGGGVWRTEGTNSTMISPPEFHYQSATLTLPVIRLSGSSGAGGAGITASISQVTRAHRIFPNSSDEYGASGPSYHNPVREGNVTVTVKSDYYQAWETYFRTRTTGEVSVDHDAETVSVKLISIGTVGDFEMPADGNAIELRGLADDHPITDFNVTIRPDDTDSANFANLQWTLYADQGSQEFEIHLRDGGKNDSDVTDDCTERDVDATVYYSESNGDPYHGWHQDGAFRTSCDDLDGDGTNETYLQANLSGTTELTMQSLSSSDQQHFSASGNTFNDSVTFDEHGPVGWEPKEFNKTASGDDTTTIGNLTNHYLSLMGPDVELTVEDKGSDTVNEDASTGTFEQTGGAGSFITFLHITENEVTIELD